MSTQLPIIALALLGGVFLAAQGGFNSQLGVQLKSPLAASLIAFIWSSAFAVMFILASGKSLPNTQNLLKIPTYLWFTGALFSVMGISLYYYTIPKLGMASMISLGLCGQLIFSIVANHYGWFGMASNPVSITKIIGMLAMITGIVLINIK